MIANASTEVAIIADPWVRAFGAPILVGLTLWFIADRVRDFRERRAATRQRRLEIVGALDRARALVFRAVRDGDYERSWIGRNTDALKGLRERYDDLTVDTLNKFVPGEEEVAGWVAAEFYAGYHDPFYYLEALGVPHEAPTDGWPYLPIEAQDTAAPYGWTPPRSDMLLAWVDGGKGPRYGDLYSAGDHSRHHIVKPNSDVNADMLRAPVWSLAHRKSGFRKTPWWRREKELPAPTAEELAGCSVCGPHASFAQNGAS